MNPVVHIASCNRQRIRNSKKIDTIRIICEHARGVTCMKLLSRDASYADAPTEGAPPPPRQQHYFNQTPAHCSRRHPLLRNHTPSPGIRRILESETGVPFPRGKPVNTSAIASIRMGKPAPAPIGTAVNVCECFAAEMLGSGTTVATNALLERNGAEVP